MAQAKTLKVRITDNTKYCPTNGDPEILLPGDVVTMPAEDGYNIVSSGRGRVAGENEDEGRVKRD